MPIKLEDNKIAIVGGGPGGLTPARRVYERDFNKDARPIGSPPDMHEGSGLTVGVWFLIPNHYVFIDILQRCCLYWNWFFGFNSDPDQEEKRQQ